MSQSYKEEFIRTPGQFVGALILAFTVIGPGLALGGFHGGTGWSVLGWVCISIIGGAVGGFLLAPGHRVAGLVGGMVGAPCALLALYLYSRGRERMYRAEAVLIAVVGGLPGFGVYFILHLLTDVLFPVRREEDLEQEEEFDDFSRRRKRDRMRDDHEDEDRPSRHRRRDDEDEDDEPPRRRRRRDEDE